MATHPMVDEQAKKIAARVNTTKVSMGFASIVALLASVLMPILKCDDDEAEPNPDQVSASIKQRHEQNPKRLLRRTAIAVRKKAPQGQRPSADDAREIAIAMIDEACEAAPEAVAALCRVCQTEG